MIIDHMEHIISVVGEDGVAIGTDLDGAIRPPRDILIDPYPRLIQLMLNRGWTSDRIEKSRVKMLFVALKNYVPE